MNGFAVISKDSGNTCSGAWNQLMLIWKYITQWPPPPLLFSYTQQGLHLFNVYGSISEYFIIVFFQRDDKHKDSGGLPTHIINSAK